MKLDAKSRARLAGLIEDALQRSGLSFSEVGRRARVDPSQVSRICRGHFRTLSHNAMQICITLGIDLTAAHELTRDGSHRVVNHARRRLADEVVELWNQTAEDEVRLIRLLRELREFRRTGKA